MTAFANLGTLDPEGRRILVKALVEHERSGGSICRCGLTWTRQHVADMIWQAIEPHIPKVTLRQDTEEIETTLEPIHQRNDRGMRTFTPGRTTSVCEITFRKQRFTMDVAKLTVEAL